MKTFNDYLENVTKDDLTSSNFEKDFINAGEYNKYLKKHKSLDVDSKELSIGKDIEMEHTTDVSISERIALDHIAEIPNYYTWLVWMENLAKKYSNPTEFEEKLRE